MLALPLGAQELRNALVVHGAFAGITSEALSDIHEEVAYTAEDLGGYVLTRDYQLGAIYGDQPMVEVVSCRGSGPCILGSWAAQQFQDVIVVNAFVSEGEIHVYIERLDVAARRSARRSIAYLPDETAFSHLAAAVAHVLMPGFDDEAPPPTPAAPSPAPAAPVATGPPAQPSSSSALLEERLRPQTRLQKSGVWLGVGGASLLVGGILLAFSADATQQEIQGSPRPRADLESLQRRGQTQTLLANTSLILGGALVATGVTFYLWPQSRERADAGRVQLDVGPRTTQLRWTLPF